MRWIVIGGVIAALALAPGAGSAQATVRAGNVSISSRTYPRVLRSTGSHRYTVEFSIQNHRSRRSLVGLSLSDLNMVFDGRMMAWALSFGPVSVQAPAVVQVGHPVPPARGVDYMCVPDDANDTFGFLVTLPPHSSTTVRVTVTVVAPYWLDSYIPFGQQGVSAIYEPDVEWNSPFLQSSQSIPVAPVRMIGPPGEQVVFGGAGEVIDDLVGGPFAIDARTDPPARDRVVVLTLRHWLGHGRWRTEFLARVRTDSSGTFQYPWVPHHTGYYQIVAHVPHPGPGVLPDGACGEIAHVVAG